MFKFFQKWKAIQKTRNELYSLDDMSLKDIGITRGEINSLYKKFPVL